MPKLLRITVTALAAAAVAISVAPTAPAATLTPGGLPVTNAAGQTFKVLAHRGGATQWPQNSVEAYTGAAQAGYDAIETDILFTADGVPVMSHYDKLPSRCTSAGTSIHTTSWADLQNVRCKDLSGKFTVPIPTFYQLADVLRAYPGVGLTLDLKTYTGQPRAELRLFASRAVRHVVTQGLLARTRFLTFNWDTVLPTIRKQAPKAYVLAYDHSGFNYDRVRLAAKLKATGYGTEAAYTSINLANFITAKGLEDVPWNLSGTQHQALSISYGPSTYWFMTDSPAAQQTQLVSGTAKLDWVRSDQATTLGKPLKVAKATFKAKRTGYVPILGIAVPTSKLSALKTVTVAISVTKGAAKNAIWLSARSADAATATKLTLPKGSGTIQANVPLGNGGQIAVRTAKKSKLTITVLGYTNQVFTSPAVVPAGR